ncbi:hypothetical protein WJX75_007585 [Coccomyxa subellipsoidea]|uniref:F-box domain-containing protein n=1 Tax=Coccomyxa subellipsoidea TaxID=248742 RepID=A0ABR2Z187_9CHLO
MLTADAKAAHPSDGLMPVEILLTIMGFLDHDTLILASQVCNQWHQAIGTDDYLWERHVMRRRAERHVVAGAGEHFVEAAGWDIWSQDQGKGR